MYTRAVDLLQQLAQDAVRDAGPAPAAAAALHRQCVYFVKEDYGRGGAAGLSVFVFLGGRGL